MYKLTNPSSDKYLYFQLKINLSCDNQWTFILYLTVSDYLPFCTKVMNEEIFFTQIKNNIEVY